MAKLAPATSATVMAIETDFVVVEPTRGMARTVGSMSGVQSCWNITGLVARYPNRSRRILLRASVTASRPITTQRYIEMVETGASRHEAAEHFGVSVSSVVKWMQRWQACRSAAPKRRGGVAFRPWNSRRNALWR